MIRCELTITMSTYTTMNIDVSSDAYQIQQLRKLISKLQSDIGKRENAFEELNLRVQLLENHKRLVQTFFVDWSIGQFKEIPISCVFYANF